VIRQGARDEGDQLINGISDEESRLNINTAELQDLIKLRDMPPETAAAIVDWRDRDNDALPGGAEKDYYASLKPPYLPRNNDIQTIREMLLIRGVTSDLLLGEDTNANGLLDPDENDGDANEPRDNRNNSLEAGWSGIFGLNSAVANKNAAGVARVNVQTASESDLTGIKGITTEIAKAIVAYRGRQKLESVVDLLDVAALAPEGQQQRNQPNQPNAQPQQQQQQPNGPPQTVGPKLISEDLFQDICDDVTTVGDSTLKGVININTASVAVLSCLPGIDEQLARRIVDYRGSAGYFASIGGLLKVDGMNRDLFKQIAPRITARSETFRIVGEGKVNSSGARERVEVVIRFTGRIIDTLSYRENL
jgi:DNA uptake protein ComE-like DNA-binding protein